MSEFFKGWRRNMGVVALVMACVVMGLSIRSHVVTDKLSNDFGGHEKYFEALLLDGNFIVCHSNHDYSKFDGRISFLFPRGIVFEQLSHENAKRDQTPEPTGWKGQGGWKCQRGFGIEWSSLHDDGHDDGISASITVWRMSMLWVVIPLTLLSAYLLLVKPRPLKPPESS